jgi:hypothetical protein
MNAAIEQIFQAIITLTGAWLEMINGQLATSICFMDAAIFTRKVRSLANELAYALRNGHDKNRLDGLKFGLLEHLLAQVGIFMA